MTTQTEAQRLAADIHSAVPTYTLCQEVAAELRRLEAANAELLEALVDVSYTLEKARIWGGMDWTYNPLHPVHYLPARDAARAAIEKHGGKA